MLTEDTIRYIHVPFKKDAFQKGQKNVGFRVRKPRDKRDLLVGVLLKDRYYVLSVLGKGGMSLVYKAKDLTNNKIVAVKALRTQGLGDETIVKRFKQEAEVLHRLNHPRIVSVYDYGTSRIGQPYFVMDYLVGVSLSQVLRKQGALPLERFQDIFVQIAAAVAHAHKHKAIHRDLKPGNIMLVRMHDTADYVKIVDFGIAKLAEDASKLTRLGEVWGSPIYMSPEQGMGTKIDTRTDIYSLGIVMYEALTGEVPFLGKNYVETMTKQMTEAPAPFSEIAPGINIPASLEMIVFKALQKSPDDRFQTMTELKTELEKALTPQDLHVSTNQELSNEAGSSRSSKQVWNFIREKMGTSAEAPSTIQDSADTREIETADFESSPAPTRIELPAIKPKASVTVRKQGRAREAKKEDFITTVNRPQVVAAALPDSMLIPSEFVQRQSQKLKPLNPGETKTGTTATESSAPAPTIIDPEGSKSGQYNQKPLDSLVVKTGPVRDSREAKTDRLEVQASTREQGQTDSRIRKRPRSAKRRTTTKMQIPKNASVKAQRKSGKKQSIKPLIITCLTLVLIATGFGIVMSPQARTLILNLIYPPQEQNQYPNQNAPYGNPPFTEVPSR